MPHLDVEAIDCLVGHPTLQTTMVGLGSVKRNEAAAKKLGLPSPKRFKINWREV